MFEIEFYFVGLALKDLKLFDFELIHNKNNFA